MSTTATMTPREIAFRNALKWIDAARSDLYRNDRIDAIDSLAMAMKALKTLTPQTPSGHAVISCRASAVKAFPRKAEP